MDLDVLAGLAGGYAETTMGLEKQSFDREQARRKARLDILSAAIPNITDPALKAEALALAEEFATGKSGGKKRGGLSQLLGSLLGRGAEDVGQGERLQGFLTRPRETVVHPETRREIELPPVPGTGGLGLTLQTAVPGLRETATGPMATPEEAAQVAGVGYRSRILAEGGAKAELDQAERVRLTREARTIGLTDPRDIANYVNQRTLPSGGDLDRLTGIAGTTSGADLMEFMPVDSLGNPVRRDVQYRLVKRADGTIGGAYPASSKTAEGDLFPDPTSEITGVSRRMYDPATGREIAPQKNVYPPAGWVPITTTSDTMRFVPQRDTSLLATPVRTTTTRERTLPGTAPAGAAPPPAAAPTGAAVPSPRAGIQNLILQKAAQHGVEPWLALAVAEQESGLDPNATGEAGDGGLFQLTPDTASRLGVQNVYDPQQNVDAGVRYLKYLLEKYGGDVQKALTAYNGGEGNVDRNTISDAAKAYPAKVLARQAAHAAPQQLPPVPGQPAAAAGTVQPGQVVGHRGMVTPKHHDDYRRLLDAKAALDSLYETAQTLATKEGPAARVEGLVQRGAGIVGLAPDVQVFNNRREALRSTLSRVVGAEVGNLALQEQEWAIKNAPAIGMTKSEVQKQYDAVTELLDRRTWELDQFIKTGQVPNKEAIAAWQTARRQVQTGPGKTVKMQAPDGTVREVPTDQVEHYKSKGAKVVP